MIHPVHGVIDVWNKADHDAGTAITTYETNYTIRTSGQKLTAKAQIRSTTLPALKSLISNAGLHVESWLGTWKGAAMSDSSADFIPVGRLT